MSGTLPKTLHNQCVTGHTTGTSIILVLYFKILVFYAHCDPPLASPGAIPSAEYSNSLQTRPELEPAELGTHSVPTGYPVGTDRIVVENLW